MVTKYNETEILSLRYREVISEGIHLKKSFNVSSNFLDTYSYLLGESIVKEGSFQSVAMNLCVVLQVSIGSGAHLTSCDSSSTLL